jgi:hypothetical protein
MQELKHNKGFLTGMLAFLLLLSLAPALPDSARDPVESSPDLETEPASAPSTSSPPADRPTLVMQRADAGTRPVFPDSAALAGVRGPAHSSPESPLSAIESFSLLASGPVRTRLGRDPPRILPG